MITLDKWFVSYDGIGYTANGIVYGHTSPRCLDGTEIHTSLIESAEVDDNEITLFTLNSEYHVSIDEMDCDCYDPWRSLRLLRGLLGILVLKAVSRRFGSIIFRLKKSFCR